MEDENNNIPKKSASKEALEKMREEDKILIDKINKIVNKLKNHFDQKKDK